MKLRIRKPIARSPLMALLRDALRRRCPNCRMGAVIERWPNKVRAACPACGLTYFREQGYYIGGMIITYALTLLVVIPIFLLSTLLPDVKGLSDYVRFALWIAFAIPLSLFFMPYAYCLWLALDYWVEPWKPEKNNS